MAGVHHHLISTNISKCIPVKMCVQKKLKKPTAMSTKTRFNSVIIDDTSDEDDTVDSCEAKDNEGVHKQLKDNDDVHKQVKDDEDMHKQPKDNKNVYKQLDNEDVYKQLKDDKDVHKQLKDTLSSCIERQITNSENELKRHVSGEWFTNGEKTMDDKENEDDNEIRQNKEHVRSPNKEINNTLHTLDDMSLKNFTLEDTILENLIARKFNVGKAIRDENNTADVLALKEEKSPSSAMNSTVDYHLSRDDEKDISNDITTKTFESMMTGYFHDEKKDTLSSVISEGKHDGNNFIGKQVSHTQCNLVETHGNLDANNGNGNVFKGSEENYGNHGNHGNHGNSEIVNNGFHEVNKQLVAIHNGRNIFCSGNEIIENDVITEVFKPGERLRAWELMKTKRRCPQRKKIIYPVVIKDVSRRKENVPAEDAQSNKASDSSIVSPLLQFQSSLENQMKELVVTMQNLHTLEKDAIIKTLTNQQQMVNKETLDALVQILNEKTGNKKEESYDQKTCNNGDNISQVDPKQCLKNQSVSKKLHPLKSCEGVIHKSKDQTTIGNNKSKDQTTIGNNKSKDQTTMGNNIAVKGSGDVIEATASVKLRKKKMDSKKKVAPYLSVLKTPVRRKKAPIPFSEKSQVELPVTLRMNAPACALLQETSAPSCALLHEILKDTSSTKDESLGNNQCYAEQGVTDENSLTSSIEEKKRPEMASSSVASKENNPMHDSEKITDRLQSDRESLYQDNIALKNSILCSVNNIIEEKSENNNLERKCEGKSEEDSDVNNGININNILQTTYTHNTQNRQYTLSKKLSLDERIHKLRQDFINSGNEWLYKSKENPCSSDTTLEDAKKVLREAETTGKMLANDNFLKYKDRNDMFSYFEANRYLVDDDVLRVKKSVDENIKKMNRIVEKKVNYKKENVKHKRMPLKERNSMT